MCTIRLKQLLPEVFAARKDLDSDVWQQDLTLERGKTYLIEAASGTGKSSLLSFLYGYRHDYTGQILFDEDDTRTYSVGQWVDTRCRHLSILWQELRLFPELTALENVLIKNNLTHHQTREQIDQWFERLGIADKREALIGQMSFGQQQRVALIRTLCQPADFIMADEPISHLDDRNAAVMAELLQQEATRQGAAIIATSIGKRLPLNYDHTLRL
ncbi:MAG: ATP-binding cassette domain-containing protein [Paludibacteraceae bacterium]|nr:ATP-binding cassette domain-containing protein [Paludibacteraceae bacterium]